MTTFQPITPNWLTGAWDQFAADDPELQEAYDWADFPSDATGEGNWVDLYLTESDEFPVGRLWVNPDTSDVGLYEVPFGNISYATKVALELREFNKHGASPLTAYEYIKRDYFCGEEQTGNLKDAKVEFEQPTT